jgi:type III restriction enzyme
MEVKIEMTEIKNLYQTIGGKAFELGLSRPEIPEYILNNLKHSLFDWQNKALLNFLIYQEVKERENPNEPTHLMFNMATGTGKTLLMASSILYYYKKGYRHFIFFVNQNNIVDKTENNFIDNNHTKYLYKDKIVIDDKTIPIKKVDTFSDNPQGIEIKFTSVQKLYEDIHKEKENQTTLEDLKKLDLVMLADEAHHFNANTKKIVIQEKLFEGELTGSVAEKEKKGWEHTIIEYILKKYNYQTKKYPEKNKNVLLEFTATIPDNESVAKKYEDKIIYKFGLKEFLSAGYTKEINLISSTLDKKERVLQALLFQWYRHKIALKNGIANFKPVILFRSKTIEESRTDYEEFLEWTSNITTKDFNFLKAITNKIVDSKNIYEQGKSRTEQVLEFIKKKNISYSEIADFIKNNFAEKNVIITNSKTNKTKTEKTSEEQEKLLNSLEDKDNHIRAIFTVARLTEGWDVLNLFDIVRMNKGQNVGGSHKGKVPEATIQEKQLIGRGVRYFPFIYNDKIKNKRKFDNNLDNELRILEELFYYTYDDPDNKADHNYIIELKAELKRDGYIKDDRIFKTFKLKEKFKDSDFYKKIKIWKNERINNPHRKKKTLDNLKEEYIKPYKVKDLKITEQIVDFDKVDKPKRQNQMDPVWTPKNSPLFKKIDKHIFRKAISIKAKQEGSLFQFERLAKELEINSIDDLQKKEFLGDFKVPIILNKNQKYEDIPNREKLNMVLNFLEGIFKELEENINPKIGDPEFTPYSFKKLFGEPKTKVIDEENEHDEVARDNNWYILDGFVGTGEEQLLIEFVKETIFNLEKKYDEIYLLRNEEVYTIYDFNKGRGFCPDFILFLKNKENESLYYQIFIEPKGDWALGNDGDFKSGKDGWKEIFLEQISQKYGLGKVLKSENRDYRLIGLPFFNKNHNKNFEESFEQNIIKS